MTQHTSVADLAAELAKAIELIMHPQTEQNARLEAHMACERFKVESPLCAQVGLYLANGDYNQLVKHFGLQLMEYTIRFKWNWITQEEKIFIKDNAMKLLLLGVGPAEDTTLAPLKDALSRIIVEMIKREWPQQWTTLLPELSDACNKGASQTELVLLIFLRLVEDVALLQTIESNQRRKDMYQALTNNMTDIFVFLLRIIELHVTSFREATQLTNYQIANAHTRVVEIALLTLSGFVEWVSINHITCSNCKLLHILCILLNDKAFQGNAAECLAQITNRKGQIKERKPLLMLLGEEPMRYIFSASQMRPDQSNQSFEQNHLFLKKLVNVLSGLTQQLTGTWGKEDASLQRPTGFEAFIECILQMASHSSLTITHGAALIWNALLKHEAIAKDPIIIAYIPKFIEVACPKIIKIPYPSIRNTLPLTQTTPDYICLDFDSDEEFAVFFHRCRTDLLEIFRQSTLVQPLITFSFCEQWLNARLTKAHNEFIGNRCCSVQDPIYLEWEALVSVLDGVLSRILLVSERPSVQTGLRLLDECLKIKTDNPLIFSILLSCISALFVFLSMSSCQITPNNCVAMSGVPLLSRVLEKIFSALIYKDATATAANASTSTASREDRKVEYTRVQATKNLRRHAASLMVKLGHKYPLLLLPVFDQINTHVKNLMEQQPLNKIERVTLQEALILISNHFCDYDRQFNFVGDVMKEGPTHWNEISQSFKSPFEFMSYVGLDKPPCPLETDTKLINRNRIMDALNTVLGVIKRCTWPDDPDLALRGCFVIGLTEHGNPIYRNPASPHVIPILPHILSLLRVLNELFKPEALVALSNGYRNIHTMLEHEKNMLMGVAIAPVDPLDPTVRTTPTPFNRMQIFFSQLYEGCYHLMGSAGPSLGRDLYQLQGLADALINSTFANLDDLPDSRLRPIIRVFFKPFVYSCPPVFFDGVLLPVFAHLVPLMFNRLNTRWTYITSLYKSGQLTGEINDTQEVLDDMLNRTLTREYLEILKIALVGGSIGSDNNVATSGSHIADVIMEPEELSMDGVTQTRSAQTAILSDIISELGTKLLRHPNTSNYILITLLTAISWDDGAVNIKAVNVIAPVMRFLIAEQMIDANKASSAFTAVLRGLQVHGQHEANQAGLVTLGVQFYEMLRPKFNILTSILQTIPNVNTADIQKFDEKISQVPIKGNKVDKAKKDLFKKLTAQLIGRSMNQLFRHEIQIANLPPMPNVNKQQQQINTDLIDTNHTTGLSQLFKVEQ